MTSIYTLDLLNTTLDPLNTQELVERTLYHSLRKHCVGRGYTPDMEEFDQTKQGYNQYLEAFKTINEEKGFSIEVFNSGTPSDRELRKVPRIAIDTQGFSTGNVGLDQKPIYTEQEDGTFNKELAPSLLSDLYFNIFIVAGSITQLRILKSIVAIAIPKMNYIPLYDNPEKFIYTNFLSYTDTSNRQIDSPYSIMTIYRYICPDLMEIPYISIQAGIHPFVEYELDAVLKEVELKIK